VRMVDVRYCGGGPTVDEHTSATARNYVTWERFDGAGVRQLARAVLPLEPGEAPMTEGTLAQGQCLAGKLGFTDEGAAPAGGRRSQFETSTSNGGRTAHPAGERWAWEQRLFGGAYDSSPATSRPRYGSLNHRRRPAGGSVRFGSAHLRLAGHTLSRTTFCYP